SSKARRSNRSSVTTRRCWREGIRTCNGRAGSATRRTSIPAASGSRTTGTPTRPSCGRSRSGRSSPPPAGRSASSSGRWRTRSRTSRLRRNGADGRTPTSGRPSGRAVQPRSTDRARVRESAAMQAGVAVDVRELERVFTPRKREPVTALDGVSLEIPAGEVHGLLGPNGAGKTTLVKILSTVLLPTAGRAFVCGHDVVTETRAVRPLIGIVFGGERGLYTRLTARQNLEYWGALYRLSGSEI